ncbi:thermostable hemolysin [uncultured Neptuniibacter sp.]|jgi:hypothetical protein|uniref:thermostable hemolysin n=1 Tax=uncultured Neptuniibacter sp. TaxID=502143 RepID=UPI0026214626|nr:thermostable hemolysin [uncultured Neptuniibacter sp.]
MNPQLCIEPRTGAERSEVVLISSAANRKHIERFAWRCFNTTYGADLKDFLPQMLALIDNQQRISASAGYQSAASARLYLEQYLPQPIEHLIQQQRGLTVTPERGQILEVGNLASISPGATRRLILSLAHYFQQQGFKWLVITATPQVRRSFEKLNLGLNLYPLAAANASALSQQTTNWGRYYDQQPQVYAGDIDSGIQVLRASPLFTRIIERIPMPVDDQHLQIKG